MLALDFVSSFSWKGIGLCGFMGVASAGAYICYTNAFRVVGSPSATFDYAMKLGLSPWFIVAVLMSALTIFARPFVYEALGGQRGYFVMTGVGAMLSAVVIVGFFKEKFDTYQYIGMVLCICGALLVARD